MTRPSIASAFLAILAPLALVAACGGAEPPAKTTAQPAVANDGKAVCVEAFQRQRQCTDVFIPALVAARVEHDAPPGIAEADATQGRDALVARAMEEWKTDSTDEAIGQTCDGMAAKIPADQQGPLTASVQQCLASADCQAFTDCMMPIVSQHMSAPQE